MQNFSYYQPTRLYFASGGVNQLARRVSHYGQRCLVVTTPVTGTQAASYQAIFTSLQEQGIQLTHFSEVIPNPPIRIIEAGRKMCRQHHCDVVLALGGGSSIDSAKIIAATALVDNPDWQYWRNNYQTVFAEYKPLPAPVLPIIALPTTSGTGSHVTHAAVITDTAQRTKFTLFHPEFFPREAIIDAELMLTLPPRMTAITGFDAFSHAFESFTGTRTSPFIDTMALEAMRLIITWLPRVVNNPADINGRTQLAIADTFAGISLTHGGAGAPHPIGEIIGGYTDLPHGLTLALVYPAYIRCQWKKQPERFARVAELFGATGNNEQKAGALESLLVNFLQEIGLETVLTRTGITADDVKTLASALHFDLPMTSAEEMKQILADSLL